MHFIVSSLGQGTEWGGGVMFWVAKIKKKNWVLEIPDIF